MTPHTSHPITAIFFDFDGTLALPTLDFALMRQHVYQTLARYGTPKSYTTPALEGIAEICATLDAQTAKQAYAQAMQSIMATEVAAAKQSSLFPFVRPMFAKLKKNNIQVSIVTRNCKEAVCTVFPDLFDHITHLVTRHDVHHVKPHPEHLEKALMLLNCSAKQALMVGDHPTDIIVGKRVGTRTAGVASGEGTWEDLAKENPTYLANNVEELMNILGFNKS